MCEAHQVRRVPPGPFRRPTSNQDLDKGPGGTRCSTMALPGTPREARCGPALPAQKEAAARATLGRPIRPRRPGLRVCRGRDRGRGSFRGCGCSGASTIWWQVLNDPPTKLRPSPRSSDGLDLPSIAMSLRLFAMMVFAFFAVQPCDGAMVAMSSAPICAICGFSVRCLRDRSVSSCLRGCDALRWSSGQGPARPVEPRGGVICTGIRNRSAVICPSYGSSSTDVVPPVTRTRPSLRRCALAKPKAPLMGPVALH